jgi:Uma2 family endonuclease
MTLDQRQTRHRAPKPVHYPERDGKPMGETDLHRDEMYRLITTLQAAFAARPDVYVSGNLLLYYEEGNPRKVVSPDVFVVFGIAKHRREIYKLWEEGAPPAVVIEVTSRTTRREDLVRKRALYAQLGVREYYLYDPRFPRLQYLDPPLQGLRLVDGDYQPIEPDRNGAIESGALSMRLHVIDRELRLFDTRSGEPLLSPAERARLESQRAEAEAMRADAEAAARRAAERRIAELEALLRERDGT